MIAESYQEPRELRKPIIQYTEQQKNKISKLINECIHYFNPRYDIFYNKLDELQKELDCYDNRFMNVLNIIEDASEKRIKKMKLKRQRNLRNKRLILRTRRSGQL